MLGVSGCEFESRLSGFGLQDSGLEIRVPDFGARVFRISQIQSQVPGVGSRVSGFESGGSVFGFCVSCFGFRVSGFGVRLLGSGCRV